MRTLDEVITAIEFCCDDIQTSCEDCPAFDEPDCCVKYDALRYLKEYRELAQNLGEVGNEPLTWDELLSMIGKPVYIEMNNGYEPKTERHWFIITRFENTIMDEEEMMCEPIWHFSKRLMGDTWQAYRKERE